MLCQESVEKVECEPYSQLTCMHVTAFWITSLNVGITLQVTAKFCLVLEKFEIVQEFILTSS